MTNPAMFCSQMALCASALALPSALQAEESDDASSTATFSLSAASAAAIEEAGSEAGIETESEAEPSAQQDRPQGRPQGQPQGQGGPPPAGAGRPKTVFDKNWVTLGIGAGLVPSYSGSDDYIAFPLPLVVGRLGGVGIRPNGPGIRLDLLSPEPAIGSNKKITVNFGPAIRFRNDRANQIEDEVVELAEDLDVALEVGAAGGVTFPGVFNRFDSLTFNTQVRWDVLGAHDGMLIEPNIAYQRPFGRGVLLQAGLGAQFVDDSFADYYYTVTPQQSADTGLPLFNADGGLNAVSSTAIVNVDLDGNALNGGLNLYTVLGYTRLVGDAADTPFTDIRGDANQFILGAGIAYTF